LRFFNHLEYQEIADTMQVSLGNVKTLIHRGKAALARELAQEQHAGLVGSAVQQEVRGRELLSL
jgi:DNA-directed RNA polymerase specialized sigma24 family protein